MGQKLKYFPCEKWLSKFGLLEPKELGASREELTAHPTHQENSSAESSLHREVEQSPSPEVLKIHKENWSKSICILHGHCLQEKVMLVDLPRSLPT